jgi:glycerol-3-phosphate dehydrogenase
VRPLLKSNSADPSSRSREHQLIATGDNFLSLCGGKYTTYRLVAKQAVDRIYAMLGSKAPACRTGREAIPDFRPPASGEKIASSPEVFASDVTHAVQKEMAMSIEDVMWRRTSLMLSKSGGEATARSVANVIRPLLGWSDEQANHSVQDYLAIRRAGI